MDFLANLNTSLSHLEARVTPADKTGVSIQYKLTCRCYHNSAQFWSWMSKSSSNMVLPKVVTSQRNINWTNVLKQRMIWILNSMKICFTDIYTHTPGTFWKLWLISKQNADWGLQALSSYIHFTSSYIHFMLLLKHRKNLMFPNFTCPWIFCKFSSPNAHTLCLSFNRKLIFLSHNIQKMKNWKGKRKYWIQCIILWHGKLFILLLSKIQDAELIRLLTH